MPLIPEAGEAEVGASVSSRSALSKDQVPGQSRLHKRNPVSRNENQQTNLPSTKTRAPGSCPHLRQEDGGRKEDEKVSGVDQL